MRTSINSHLITFIFNLFQFSKGNLVIASTKIGSAYDYQFGWEKKFFPAFSRKLSHYPYLNLSL